MPYQTTPNLGQPIATATCILKFLDITTINVIPTTISSYTVCVLMQSGETPYTIAKTKKVWEELQLSEMMKQPDVRSDSAYHKYFTVSSTSTIILRCYS